MAHTPCQRENAHLCPYVTAPHRKEQTVAVDCTPGEKEEGKHGNDAMVGALDHYCDPPQKEKRKVK